MRSTLQLCVRMGAALVRQASSLVLLVVVGLAAQLHAAQPVTPTITWNMPSPFVYGTSIPSAVATHPTSGAIVPGSFTYSPSQATVLAVTGSPVRLRVTFRPTDTGTYRNNVSVNRFVTVTRAPLTVSASASKLYGAAVTAPVVSYSGFKFSDTASVLSGAPALSHPVLASSNVGSNVITVGAGTLSATNYQIVAVNGTYAVTRAPLSVTANAASRAYGVTNPAFTGTLTGIVNNDAITATFASSATATTAVGVYSASSAEAITPTLVDPGARLGNYNVTSFKAALTITTAPQSISGFSALPVYTYGNAPFTINGVTGGASGQPVIFASNNALVATVSGTTVTITGSGTAVITATQAGNSNYAAATPVSQTLTVNKATLNVAAAPGSRAYGAANPLFTGTLAGVVNGDGITATYASSATATTAVGIYAASSAEAIMPTLVDPGTRLGHYQVVSTNGALTITQAEQVISFAPLLDVVDGAPDQALVASATSGLPVAFSVSGPAMIVSGQLHVTGAGTVTVTATQSGDANYLAATPMVRSITVTAGGTGLLASYYANETVSGTPVLTRLEPAVNHDWGNGSPAPGVPVESFSARWDGEIQTRFTEPYTLTFRTDDGVRVWLDGQLVVNFWNLRSAADSNYTFNAEAGRRYRVRIEYYEHTGLAVAMVRWDSASEPAGPIPSSQLYPTPPDTSGPVGTGTGLTAAYYTNEALSGLPAVTRLDAGVAFDWAGGSPAVGIPADSFSARWSGEIQTRYSEPYTLVLRTDDGVRMWLDGQLVINDWILRGAADSTYTFNALAGQRYTIRIEYYEHQGSAVAQLSWYSAREYTGPVPATQLYPRSNSAPVAADDGVATAFGTPVTIPVVANDSDPDGDAMQVTAVGEATYGVSAPVAGGLSVRYTPKVGFTGTDVFYYVVSDGLGGTALGWVTVTVQSPADLVLHWKFNEDANEDQARSDLGIGHVAWDSARIHHAGVIGEWTRTVGKDGNAVAINGGGYIQAYDAADLQLQRMTLAMWLKPTQQLSGMPAYFSLFERFDWENNSGYWFGGMSGNQIGLMLLNGTSVEERKTITYEETSQGVWFHLAAVYDGDTMSIYRDGVVVASQQVGVLTLNYQGVRALSAVAGFTGAVDDVRVYDRALSVGEIGSLVGVGPGNAPPVITLGADQSVVLPATAQVSATVSDDGQPGGAPQLTWLQVGGPALIQFSDVHVAAPVLTFTTVGAYELRLKASDGELSSVADLFVTVYPAGIDLQQGLVAHWQLDEGTGSLAADSSGRGNDAQIHGFTQWQAGYSGSSLNFGPGGAYNDFALAPDSPSLRVGQLTVSAWMKADKAPSAMAVPYPLLLSKIDWAGNTGFEFGFLAPDALGLRLMHGGDVFGRAELAVPQTGLAGGWHHVCGVYDGAQLRIYRNGVEVGRKQVGRFRINHGAIPAMMGQCLEGNLDDIRLYDRALAPAEVDALTGIPPSGPG